MEHRMKNSEIGLIANSIYKKVGAVLQNSPPVRVGDLDIKPNMNFKSPNLGVYQGDLHLFDFRVDMPSCQQPTGKFAVTWTNSRISGSKRIADGAIQTIASAHPVSTYFRVQKHHDQIASEAIQAVESLRAIDQLLAV
jgi:hypothetical protein